MKTNIDIDIGNINILLQYIAQQYIDLYPCMWHYGKCLLIEIFQIILFWKNLNLW